MSTSRNSTVAIQNALTTDTQTTAQQQKEVLALCSAWFTAVQKENVEQLKELRAKIEERKLIELIHVDGKETLKDDLQLLFYARQYAFASTNIPMLMLLVDMVKTAGGSVETWLHEPLLHDMSGSKKAIVSLLTKNQDGTFSLKKQREYDGEYSYPLIYAINQKNSELAEFLIEHATSQQINSRLCMLSDYGCFGKDWTEYQAHGTALTGAIENGMTDIVKLLINKGALLNTLHSDTRTSIIDWHARNIAGAGVHLDWRTPDLTPLMVAAKHNFQEIAAFLLQQGVDVNEKNWLKKTAIDFAYSEPMKALLLAAKEQQAIAEEIEKNAKMGMRH